LRNKILDLESQSDTDRMMALFIDGDNISHNYINDIIKESSKFGQVVMKRVYGNWNSDEMRGWRDRLQDNALTPCQVFPNVKGKNATDSALIIDVMDIMHEGTIGGFCIVTSDSDFTALALRVKEHGKFVLGLGSRSTHKSFTNACTKFTLLENLGEGGSKKQPVKKAPPKKPEKPNGNGAAEKKPAKPKKEEDELLELLLDAYDNVDTDKGSVHLSVVIEYINKIDPGFDPRNYGVSKSIKLIEMYPEHFSIEKEKGYSVVISKISK